MIGIERLILKSVLENNFVSNDARILKVDLNPDYFEHKHHKVFVRAINRLKELNQPVDTDTMRTKFKSVRAWDMAMIDGVGLEDSLLDILGANPAGTLGLFNSYYKFLEDNYKQKIKIEALKHL
jgi:hypothetical protein